MMKNLLFIAALTLLLQGVFAQLPQAINYQAMARNSNGDVIPNSSIAVRMSIRDTSITGAVVYAERDTATTNQFGLFTVAIGSGNVISGTFSGVNWGGAAKFLQVDLDPTGGSQYTAMGTTQMLSVPYALFAGKAHTADSVTSATGWQLTGNTGTYAGADFIGTTDYQPLTLRVNNTQAGYLAPNGMVMFGIGVGLHAGNNSFTVAIGDSAMLNQGGGRWNTAVGSKTLMNNQNGEANTALGFQSLIANTTGYFNTAIGAFTLSSDTTGSENVAIGPNTLYANGAGSNNIAIGPYAMEQNQTGSGNIALGLSSLQDAYVGNNNIGIGLAALTGNAFGQSNIAIGPFALGSSEQGSNLVAIGDSAMLNAGGIIEFNTAVGSKAMMLTTNGDFNTALGSHALFNNTTGYRNTAVGLDALIDNTTGTFNTAIGDEAGANSGTVTNNVAIGYYAGANSTASNSVELGNSSITAIRAQVASITAYSDARIKDNVQANVPGLAFINLLRPVTYHINLHRENDIIYANKSNQQEWEGKYDIEKITQTGFIAQEVEKAANQVGYDFNGLHKPTGPTDLYGLGYTDFVMPLVKSVQELSTMVQQLQKDNEALRKEMEAIKTAVAK